MILLCPPDNDYPERLPRMTAQNDCPVGQHGRWALSILLRRCFALGGAIGTLAQVVWAIAGWEASISTGLG